MIPGKWKDPNFRFKAEDAEGKPYDQVVYAASEKVLRQRLAALGLEKVQVTSFKFATWRKRAAKKLEALSEAKRKKDRKKIFDRSALWQELKWHLFELFHGKCAYCEWNPGPGSSGDVEHYRPKQSVADKAEHPGYFWLAYEPSNLLPSCEKCNRVRGKLTQFPVEPGTRAFDDAAVAKEKPLLLNPYEKDFDPLEHLTFELGVARGLDDRGKRSVKILNLNRPGLREGRAQAQEFVEQDWDRLTMRTTWSEAVETLEKKLRTGDREYSAACLDQLYRVMRERLATLEGLIGGKAS